MSELNNLSPDILALAPLHIIRTETVLSKLPIHNLAKTGSIEIQVHRKNSGGEVDLRWEVSYSSRYGQPRQLAYKIDTIYINRKIDELGRPVPKVVRLGSLRDIARALDLGGDTNNVRRALRQNAFAAISARLTYRSTDGAERRLEADFTRYSVIFAGERLPDGRQADSVHLILNDPYLEVLNSAPMRPLNYDYLKELPPAAQRFYEIVSYKIFAALKYRQAWARLAYSDCCTFSAMQRYHDYDHFKKQMYKIHRPHLQSGYLAKVRHEAVVDSQGQPDWMMLYEPGPKALSEFATFEKNRGSLPPAPTADTPAASDAPPVAALSAGDRLVPELMRRGVSERQARKLAETLPVDQPALEQLEWGDCLIARARQKIQNPPGFYVYLLREKVLPPAEFTATRRPSHPAGQDLPAEPDLYQLRQSYEEYKREEIDHYIAARYSPETYNALIDEKTEEVRKRYRSAAFWSPENLRQVAEGALRAEVAERIAFVSFENFKGDGQVE